VRVNDNTANQQETDDAFYILKDTSAPSITDSQGRGNPCGAKLIPARITWTSPTPGGSLLSKFQVKITTGQAQTGTLVSDWSDVLTGYRRSFLYDDWQLTAGQWNLLLPGTNTCRSASWIMPVPRRPFRRFLRAQRHLGPGDNRQPVRRRCLAAFGGTAYNIDFADGGSGLAYARYEVWDGPGKTGGSVLPLTDIPGVTGTSFAADWAVDFNLLSQGTNYVSVTAPTISGNQAVLEDVFYVLKDNSPPSITNNQTGDLTWRKTDPGAIYNVDFGDLTSGMTTAQYRITSTARAGGAVFKDWTI